MNIVINLKPIFDFFNLPPEVMIWKILVLFGWIPLVLVLLWGIKEIWLYYIRVNWSKTINYIYLAIDIPKGNEQSPKAVENIFSYLLGAHKTFNLIEKYWLGMFSLSFSFEIVSIEGYTQFIIRTPEHFRNLVESAIYSQYPDAEITEVDDYTENTPSKFPDDEYDIWGAEFIHASNYLLPIRTYKEFEHIGGKPEEYFKDPMATLMDLCSSLGPGEQLWYQIIISPADLDWHKEGDVEIGKILGEKQPSKKNFFDHLIDLFLDIMGEFSEAIISLWGGIKDEKKEEEKDDTLKMMNLRPKEKKQVEAIQEKVSKMGYNVKIRMIYLARKEVKNMPKVVNGFVGYIKQYSAMDLGNLKPDMDMTATSTAYFFKEKRLNQRKTNIINNYKARDASAGRTPKILNIEELASLWHFPLESAVKAPLIQKTSGRKAEAPISLPISEEIVSEESIAPIFEEEIIKANEKKKSVNIEKKEEKKTNQHESLDELTLENKGENKSAPPSNLPFV